MNPGDIDWGTGTVVYWEMDGIDVRAAITAQLDELKEDLVQVRFGEETLLDVGWYPEFSRDGSFVVTVVRREDWDEPLYRQKAESVEALRTVIKKGIDVAGG